MTAWDEIRRLVAENPPGNAAESHAQPTGEPAAPSGQAETADGSEGPLQTGGVVVPGLPPATDPGAAPDVVYRNLVDAYQHLEKRIELWKRLHKGRVGDLEERLEDARRFHAAALAEVERLRALETAARQWAAEHDRSTRVVGPHTKANADLAAAVDALDQDGNHG